MAVVSEKHKAIFIHIFKTAGNSAREALDLKEKEFLGAHVDARAVRGSMMKHDREEEWLQYLKFTFVRNPFDWLVSTYLHMKTWGEGWRQKPVKEQDMDFTQFLDYIVNNLMAMEQNPTSNKYQLQKEFVVDSEGASILDFVGRFEHFERDLAIVAKKLGVEYEEVPRINVSTERANRPYRDFYSEENRQFVELHFKDDLEFFGYKF